MKNVKRKKIKKIENKSENYNSVLLEHMHGDIKLIAEGQTVITRQLGEFKSEMYGFKDEMYEFRDGMYGFKKDTESNFKSIFEYLSRIEDEVIEIKENLKNNYERKGWDKEWRNAIEKRLEKIEKSLISKNVVAKSC